MYTYICPLFGKYPELFIEIPQIFRDFEITLKKLKDISIDFDVTCTEKTHRDKHQAYSQNAKPVSKRKIWDARSQSC